MVSQSSCPCRTFLANQSTLDGTPGGFDILDTAGDITANLDQLNDSHIDAITISDNGNVVSSVQQLTTDATAIGKLQNANLSPVLLAINDTAADVQAGLSTLVADAGEIASITASNGPIVVSAATFLADRSALDKIVGGFAISDAADVVVARLDQLNDPNISAITISDNGQISASVAQLTTDATAIGDLRNANASPVRLAINDTAGAVQTGLSTLVADTGEIASITASYGPIVVSAATFLADQSTLDKIMGGFDVSDAAANLVADLSTLNADSRVAAITADIGDATLSGGAGVNAPNFSESGWGTSLTVSEALASGALTLEFDSAVSSSTTVGSQNIGFTGGGTLDLTDPTSFYGEMSSFAAGDTVELSRSWAFSGISEAAGVTTLTLASGSTKHGFEFVGNFTQNDFSITSGTTTKIGHT